MKLDFYLDKEDLEKAVRNLDLGESTTVRIVLYPHKDDIPDLVKCKTDEESK